MSGRRDAPLLVVVHGGRRRQRVRAGGRRFPLGLEQRRLVGLAPLGVGRPARTGRACGPTPPPGCVAGPAAPRAPAGWSRSAPGRGTGRAARRRVRGRGRAPRPTGTTHRASCPDIQPARSGTFSGMPDGPSTRPAPPASGTTTNRMSALCAGAPTFPRERRVGRHRSLERVSERDVHGGADQAGCARNRKSGCLGAGLAVSGDGTRGCGPLVNSPVASGGYDEDEEVSDVLRVLGQVPSGHSWA